MTNWLKTCIVPEVLAVRHALYPGMCLLDTVRLRNGHDEYKGLNL